MPQADLLTFRPTLAVLPVVFLVGYFWFATHWVPRIQLTLKARHWVTAFPLGVSHEGWPELFLMSVQFAGLLFFLSRLTLVVPPRGGLRPRVVPPPGGTTLALLGGARLENVLLLWGAHRGGLFFGPAALEVTHLVGRVLGGFAFFVPPPQLASLVGRLRPRLARVSTPPAGRDV